MSDGSRGASTAPRGDDDLLNVRALSYSNPCGDALLTRQARAGRVLEFVNYGTSPAPELFN